MVPQLVGHACFHLSLSHELHVLSGPRATKDKKAFNFGMLTTRTQEHAPRILNKGNLLSSVVLIYIFHKFAFLEVLFVSPFFPSAECLPSAERAEICCWTTLPLSCQRQ